MNLTILGRFSASIGARRSIVFLGPAVNQYYGVRSLPQHSTSLEIFICSVIVKEYCA